MKGYRVNGGLKRGSAIVLAACFLLGSSITSLAAGDGLADGYEGLVDASEVKEVTEDGNPTEMDVSDELQEFARLNDLNPEDIVIIYDDIEMYGDTQVISWIVPAGKTYVSASGHSKNVGDTVAVSTKGIPNTIEYQAGLQEPDAVMWGKQGKGTMSFTLTIRKKGTHYFFVTNLSKTTDLDLQATVIW